MSDIRFYHMERSRLEQVLPALLSKALSQGHRVVVKTQDVEPLNGHLWTYDAQGDASGFLPHGSAKDGHADLQPVFLTDQDENPNDADVLILTHGMESPAVADYALCCEMLDGNDQAAVEAARARWGVYKEAGHDVTYWQQGERGWEKKAG